MTPEWAETLINQLPHPLLNPINQVVGDARRTESTTNSSKNSAWRTTQQSDATSTRDGMALKMMLLCTCKIKPIKQTTRDTCTYYVTPPYMSRHHASPLSERWQVAARHLQIDSPQRDPRVHFSLQGSSAKDVVHNEPLGSWLT